MSETILIKFKKILSVDFLLIFLAMTLSTVIDQSITKQIELAIKSPMGLSNMIWVWGATSLLSSLFFPIVITLLCCFALTQINQTKVRLFSEKFELTLLETLRSWGKTFLWSFLFIIPGVIKYSYYFMTPFVVIFSKKYTEGQVDALEHSAEISKRFFWKLNLWITFFYVLLPLVTSSAFDEYKIFATHPYTALISVLFESFVVFLFHYIMLKLFIKNLNEVENGTYV